MRLQVVARPRGAVEVLAVEFGEAVAVGFVGDEEVHIVKPTILPERVTAGWTDPEGT